MTNAYRKAEVLNKVPAAAVASWMRGVGFEYCQVRDIFFSSFSYISLGCGHLSMKIPNVKFDINALIGNSTLGFQH